MKRANASERIGLNLRQLVELHRVILVMRQRMERVRHTDLVIRTHADFLRHHESRDPRDIRRLVG